MYRIVQNFDGLNFDVHSYSKFLMGKFLTDHLVITVPIMRLLKFSRGA